MKKIDLIHTTILIVAILAAYSAIEYFFYLLGTLAYMGDSYFKSSESLQINYILKILLFSAACAVLVKNGRKYAGMLLKDDPESSWEEGARLHLDRRDIMLVLFIGLGLYTLIQSIPNAISDFFELFRNKIGSGPIKEGSQKNAPLLIELLRITIGTFIIYAAPTLTNFIIKKIAVRSDSES